MNPPASPRPLAERLPLALTLLAAVALALAVMLGAGLYGELHGAGAGIAALDGRLPPAAVLPQAAPEAQEVEEAAIELGDGVVHFYFATGSAELPEDAALALAEVVKGVAAGQHAVISGWHDATDSQAQNAALAKERAEAVQRMLAELGVEGDKVELRRPEDPDAGSSAEARRVDVWLE